MKIGFIGGGMMGEALMKGIIAQGKVSRRIYMYLRNQLSGQSI